MANENANDYSAFADTEAPTAGGHFATLDALIKKAQGEELESERLAGLLKASQERLRDLTWRAIPQLMDEMGMDEFKNKSGLKVVIKEDIEAGITEANRAAAYDWLDENGHSGLLKRDVTVSFSKNQEDEAGELAKELTGKFAAVSTNMKVHPSTLKAWVKEVLDAGESIPLDTFGVFRRRTAKFSVTKPKASGRK